MSLQIMQESPSELPISVSSSPAGISRLPLETFHRIFRLLPPRTFYATVPFVCRVFRAASVNAIPGCPGGNTVAIDCSVTLSFDPPDDSDFDAVQYADVESGISCEFFCPEEFPLVAAEAEAGNNVVRTSFRAKVFVYPGTLFEDDGVNLRELLSSFVTVNAPLDFMGLLGRSGMVFNVANISQVTLVGRAVLMPGDITFKSKTFRGRNARQTALVSPKVSESRRGLVKSFDLRSLAIDYNWSRSPESAAHAPLNTLRAASVFPNLKELHVVYIRSGTKPPIQPHLSYLEVITLELIHPVRSGISAEDIARELREIDLYLDLEIYYRTTGRIHPNPAETKSLSRSKAKQRVLGTLKALFTVASTQIKYTVQEFHTDTFCFASTGVVSSKWVVSQQSRSRQADENFAYWFAKKLDVLAEECEGAAKEDSTESGRKPSESDDDDRSSNLLSAPRRKLQRRSQE
ncbi:hypothetical protein M427DRAFT_502123 [Gonapodya prolifera JEL478]|uniref:F-box domain-containing protein n=1 Tax=Gonapodya prolifera (strain JEL478) TaxID=1344416 RepID=A0A139A7N3_GONPJ|nr:hypothetical protein M427DRAFT_502123 [Gonapodya prolifera JEL478]|eukprot:KXS12790.1 hypothetical protein M427DRAFT_502123 [Gonapodya prolifera JEL478]